MQECGQSGDDAPVISTDAQSRAGSPGETDILVSRVGPGIFAAAFSEESIGAETRGVISIDAPVGQECAETSNEMASGALVFAQSFAGKEEAKPLEVILPMAGAAADLRSPFAGVAEISESEAKVEAAVFGGQTSEGDSTRIERVRRALFGAEDSDREMVDDSVADAGGLLGT